MHRQTRRAGALLVVLAFLAGCGAFATDAPEPDALRESVVETNQSIDRYVATYEFELELPNDTTTTQAKLFVDRPNRVLYRYRAPENVSGDRLLRNDSSIRIYDSDTNTLTVIGEAGNDGPSDPLARQVRLLTEGNVSYTGQTEGEDGVVLGYAAGDVNVSLEFGGGPGRSTFNVDGDVANRTVWVNPEQKLPVRIRSTFSVDNETLTATYRLKNITINPDLEPGTFDLELPSDVTVWDRTNFTQTFESREALEEAAPFDVPKPDIPSEFSLQDATLLNLENGTTAVMTFTNGSDAGLSVSISSVPSASAQAGDFVEVAGRTVRVETVSGTVRVSWHEEDIRYTVSGTVERKTVLAVVESILDED